MRPGVPWNVKGIEAEAREAAQLAARRAGVSLGEYLTQLIMTEGRAGGAASSGYSQAYQNGYPPSDGTYGPQPMQQQYQAPLPSPRYPHLVPQGQPQSYAQAFQQHMAQAVPRYEQAPQHYPQPPQGQPMRDSLGGAAQALDSQFRGSEFTVVAHGLRDLADRLENSERRAQTAIATVNQSVAAMQDRIDAAERVKQLADVAFTSAADALAQSARDQASAFESLESTVRSVQKRMNDIESGNAQWPSKDAVGKLETALGQLQKRLGELETAKPDDAHKDQLSRLEATLGQLQKRLGEMERAKLEFPHKDSLARLETWINDVRHDVADSEKRSREDISQIAKFIHDLGSRVEVTERTLANGGGTRISEGVAARLDALEARSASMFDEMRGQLSSIDGRLAQANTAKTGGIQHEAFVALKRTVDTLSERVEQSAQAAHGVQPEAFAALKRSVDTLSSTFDGLTERLDLVSDPSSGPLAGSMDAIGSTLETLTTKIEESERRATESVSTVSGALKSISTRLDESDRKQTHALSTINLRLDETERTTSETARSVENSLRALTQRLDTSDQKHKDSIAALRLTVDGIVAKEAANAIPLDASGRYGGASQFSTATARSLSGFSAPPAPPLTEPPAKDDDGYSVSALQTIMAGTLSAPPPSGELPDLEPEAFARDDDFAPKKEGLSFLEQARAAAKAAAQAEAERSPQKRGNAAYREEGQGGRKLGRLVIIGVAGLALIGGLFALLFTFPSGNDDINRPNPGASMTEILNGNAPVQPAEPTPSAGSPAEFAPPSTTEGVAPTTPSVAVEPSGPGAPTSEPAAPAFTSGQPVLPGPGSAPAETQIAELETGAVGGNANAQFLLGLRYAEGRGVAKDDAKAASLVTKAAQQGLIIAEYRLGAIYERGVGLPKDLMQARNWYELAAKGGNRKAMHNLAVLYADGTGVGQNLPEAARWFREGADHGLPDSQYNLGILLERGMGVQKNVNEAAKWFAVAASQGDAGAAERLEGLKRTMSAADVAIALETARKFKPKPLNPTANEVPNYPG